MLLVHCVHGPYVCMDHLRHHQSIEIRNIYYKIRYLCCFYDCPQMHDYNYGRSLLDKLSHLVTRLSS